jgi:hypothetical protein
MVKESPAKSVRSRPRGRSTASVIKAAKLAGAASVTFPDGTVVTLAPDQAPVADNPATEVDRWFANHAG